LFAATKSKILFRKAVDFAFETERNAHFGIGPTINLHGIEFRAVLPQAG